MVEDFREEVSLEVDFRAALAAGSLLQTSRKAVRCRAVFREASVTGSEADSE